MAPSYNMPAPCMVVLILAFLSSPAHGFAFTSMTASRRPTQKDLIRRRPLLPMHLAKTNNESNIPRVDFISKCLLGSLVALAPGVSNGFEGGAGAGGLGKTRPQTGVVFRDPERAAETTQSSSGDVNYELIAPDGTPVFLSFSAPYPLLKSSLGIEARVISGGYESSYVQVSELPKEITSLDSIKPALLSQIIFGSTGKFGAYGSPTDIKIKKIPQSSNSDSGMAVFQASFTTLTPAMRESDRKAYISASIVGDGLFILVTTTTSARFGKLEGVLRKVADSFAAVSAPKSNLNQRKSSK